MDPFGFGVVAVLRATPYECMYAGQYVRTRTYVKYVTPRPGLNSQLAMFFLSRRRFPSSLHAILHPAGLELDRPCFHRALCC